jgi:hypothetical protein
MAPGSVIRALAPGGVAQRRAGAIRSVTVVDPARR